jgi:hypothetical protein
MFQLIINILKVKQQIKERVTTIKKNCIDYPMENFQFTHQLSMIPLIGILGKDKKKITSKLKQIFLIDATFWYGSCQLRSLHPIGFAWGILNPWGDPPHLLLPFLVAIHKLTFHLQAPIPKWSLWGLSGCRLRADDVINFVQIFLLFWAHHRIVTFIALK